MEQDPWYVTLRTDEELVDWALSLLRVKDRATLSALIDSGDYVPLGCGCCSWAPFSWYDSWDKKGKPGTDFPKSSFRFATDDYYVMRLNEEYTGE